VKGLAERPLALLAMLISPPFAFLLGIVGAVVLWNVLADVDLPGWARLGLSLMAVPAVPGIWFLFLPILFRTPRAVRLGDDEYQAWQDRQMKVWEEHRVKLSALGAQPIERVIAVGSAVTVREVTITVIAVALGRMGGDIGLAHSQRLRDDGEEMDFSIGELMAEVSDDIGTAYVAMGSPIEMSAVGARTHVAFFPAVPPDATELRLRIPRLFGLGSIDATDGPWDFCIPLVQPDR
jgi:hypothetical protein